MPMDEERMNEETDALLVRLAERRRADDLSTMNKSNPHADLVFKVTEDSLLSHRVGVHHTEKASAMDDESARQWNEWLQEHLARFADTIGDEVGRSKRQLRDEISARLDEIENRLSDIEVRIISELEGNSKSAVIPLQRGGHAA
jgi:hypothetical protein